MATCSFMVHIQLLLILTLAFLPFTVSVTTLARDTLVQYPRGCGLPLKEKWMWQWRRWNLAAVRRTRSNSYGKQPSMGSLNIPMLSSSLELSLLESQWGTSCDNFINILLWWSVVGARIWFVISYRGFNTYIDLCILQGICAPIQKCMKRVEPIQWSEKCVA